MTHREDHLIDHDRLIQHLANPRVRILDCRFTGDRASSHQAYLAGHIPGALHVDWLTDLSAADTTVTTLLPDPARGADRLSRLGIGADTLVVGYADNADLYAARLWHVLRHFGHAAVRLLDGGLAGWIAAGQALEFTTPLPASTRFPIRPTLDNPIQIRELHERLCDPTLHVLDVRTADEYAGKTRRAARGGHIPGAIHLPWTELVDATDHFLTEQQLQTRFADVGLDPASEIVTYCQGGVRAAHTALALALAGFTQVRIYVGSWAEWGNDPALPVTTGAE